MPKLIDLDEARGATVAEMLAELADSEDAQEATGAMVIFLRDDKDTYCTWHYQTRINYTQIIALLMDQVREVQDEMREGAE